MASSLRRSLSLANPHRYSLLSSTRSRSFSSSSSDALVETKPGEVGIVSGIPQEHLRRRVVIYSPARTATQQGSGKVGRWKINFLPTQKWENPLMGWTSTGDPYANVGDAGLSFDSEEAAKAFAEKHGWEYVVKKRHTPLLKEFAGLDGDYLRRTFGSVLDIIPLADSITKLTARCELCGKRAFFTLRKTNETKTELIGGSDVYMPVCRQHYVNGQVVIESARDTLESCSKAQTDSYQEEVVVA